MLDNCAIKSRFFGSTFNFECHRRQMSAAGRRALMRGSYITNMRSLRSKRWAGHTKAMIALEIYTKMLKSDPEVLAMKANTGDGK